MWQTPSIPRTSKTAPSKKNKIKPKTSVATSKLPSFSLLKPDTPLLKSIVTQVDKSVCEAGNLKDNRDEEREEEEVKSGEEESGESVCVIKSEEEEDGDEVDEEEHEKKDDLEEKEKGNGNQPFPATEAPSSTMKFSGEAEILGVPVDTLFLNNNWGSGGSCDFLIDGTTKLILDNNDDDMAKVTMDTLDSLLLTNANEANGNLAELKPLPPFTGYTGHLSINGIPGHHYHAIANQPPSSPSPSLEANNNLPTVANQNTCNNSVMYKNNGATLYYEVSTTASEQSVVSSSVDCVNDVKSEVDYNALLADDIAAIIGSAIADTTVPNVVDSLDDPNASRDSWMDLDALIDGACISENGQKTNESSQEFVPPLNCESASVTLQNLLQHGSQYGIHTEVVKQEPTVTSNYQGNISLLQTRLQNGPPNCKVLQDCNAPTSTSYINGKDMMLPHTTSGSPPGHVSTTENILLNGRYIQNRRNYSTYRSVKVPSPDMLVNGNSLDNIVSGSGINSNFPHTTTSNLPNKKSRNRSNKKSNQMVFDGVGILGKEKPIHRCSICSRGFLNKSNIKVHLRTHTGEKPFRCEVCGKAFRQKAHLIKHQQMHKRVGRD